MKKIIYILLCLYSSTYSMQRAALMKKYTAMPASKLDSKISRLESKIKEYKQQYDPNDIVPIFTKNTNPRDLYKASQKRVKPSQPQVGEDKFYPTSNFTKGQERSLNSALFNDTGKENQFIHYYTKITPLETKLKRLKDARSMQQIEDYLP